MYFLALKLNLLQLSDSSLRTWCKLLLKASADGKKIFLEGLVNLSALLSVQAVMNVSFCLRRSSDIFIALMPCWAFFLLFSFCGFVVVWVWLVGWFLGLFVWFLRSSQSPPPLYSESQLCPISDFKVCNYQCTDTARDENLSSTQTNSNWLQCPLISKGGSLCVHVQISKCTFIFLLAQMVKEGLLPHSK